MATLDDFLQHHPDREPAGLRRLLAEDFPLRSPDGRVELLLVDVLTTEPEGRPGTALTLKLRTYRWAEGRSSIRDVAEGFEYVGDLPGRGDDPSEAELESAARRLLERPLRAARTALRSPDLLERSVVSPSLLLRPPPGVGWIWDGFGEDEGPLRGLSLRARLALLLRCAERSCAMSDAVVDAALAEAWRVAAGEASTAMEARRDAVIDHAAERFVAGDPIPKGVHTALLFASVTAAAAAFVADGRVLLLGSDAWELRLSDAVVDVDDAELQRVQGFCSDTGDRLGGGVPRSAF